MRVLFLLKKHLTSAGDEIPELESYGGQKAGLHNSAQFVVDALNEIPGIHASLEVCIDGNSIDRQLHLNKPDFCVIEAVWVTPDKIKELVKLHPKVKFLIRVHSKISFLTNEGNAVGWIKQYSQIPHVYVAFNEKSTECDFRSVGIRSFYLPNLYKKIKYDHISLTERLSLLFKYVTGNGRNVKRFLRKRFLSDNFKTINVGCFGAIRPMKNQLLQAFASMGFAEEHGVRLRFHINVPRVEQNGESTLKNLRSLFEGTKHELVEHGWLSHRDFRRLVARMDVGLQMSFSESFNIVSADFVSRGVPIISSEEVTWLPKIARIPATDSKGIRQKIKEAVLNKKLFSQLSKESLIRYKRQALRDWYCFLLLHK